MPLKELDDALIAAIPLQQTLGLRIVHDRPPPAVVLPERAELANHLRATMGAAVFAVALLTLRRRPAIRVPDQPEQA